MLASMPSITAQPGAQPERPTALPLGTRHAARVGAGLALRWASRRTRSRSLSAAMLAESNRLLSAAAESVCITSLPSIDLVAILVRVSPRLRLPVA